MKHIKQLRLLGAERPLDYLTAKLDPKAINEKLSWINLNLTDKNLGSNKELLPLQDLLENAHSLAEYIPKIKTNILQRATSYVKKNLFKGVNNLIHGRKKRKWLTVLAGMGVGAAIGFVIGTFVFPGLGSVIGGALGGTLAGIGSAVIGAGLGTWIAKRIAKRYEPKASEYKIKPKQLQALLKWMPDQKKSLREIHAYLVNRMISVKDPTLKSALNSLRKMVFSKPSKEGLDRLVYYLGSEYQALLDLDNPKSSHLNDKQFIKKILLSFKENPNINNKAKDFIDSLLSDDRNKRNTNFSIHATRPIEIARSIHQRGMEPVLKTQTHQTLRFSNTTQANELSEPLTLSCDIPVALTSAQFIDYEKNFQQSLVEALPNLNIVEKLTAIGDDLPGSRIIHYFCQEKDSDLSIEVTLQEKTLPSGVSIEMTAHETHKELSDQQAKILTLQMARYLEAAQLDPKTYPIVLMTQKNPETAITLMAEALKLGLNPQLDPEEFPEKDKEIRKEILRKATQRAGLAPKPIGFKI